MKTLLSCCHALYPQLKHYFLLFIFLYFSTTSYAIPIQYLKQLQQSYPNQIISIDTNYIIWADGSKMMIDKESNKTQLQKVNTPSLSDQLNQERYPSGKNYTIAGDPGRIRYEPFFRKMYGNTNAQVEKNLIVIFWMPKIFGKKFPLNVTTINQIDKKLIHISNLLEQLVKQHPEYIKYLAYPGGTFAWRKVAHTNRLSPHSFGMTIDINPKYSNYWQWELEKQGKGVNESTPVIYKNSIPLEIVVIFESQGFIWGGKWYHYDTMHFEYRPELFQGDV